MYDGLKIFDHNFNLLEVIKPDTKTDSICYGVFIFFIFNCFNLSIKKNSALFKIIIKQLLFKLISNFQILFLNKVFKK